MKILIIHGGEIKSPGGVRKTIKEISTHLSKRGHNVTLLQENPLNLPNEEFYEGFKIIRIKSKRNFYGLNLELYNYIKINFKDLDPDIIHVHGYHTLLSAEIIYLIQRIDSNIPIVFSPHFGIFSHDSFVGKHFGGIYNRIIGSNFIKVPSTIIVASNFEANNVNEILSVPKEKIITITHGVNEIDLNKPSKSDVLTLLFVGYLLELKGVQYILKSIHELVNRYDVNVCFKIVGEGPYRKRLKILAKKLKVDQFVKWEGFVSPVNHDKLMEFYKNADIFLLLSQSENYGIVVSEALAMGTPTIVTKRTALTEFLNEPGCFGVNYPPKPEEVADLIMKIYENDIPVGPFSEKIRTWDKVIEDYERIYFKLIKED